MVRKGLILSQSELFNFIFFLFKLKSPSPYQLKPMETPGTSILRL